MKIDFTTDARNTSVMDVNGDGLVDVVFSGATEMQTFYSLGQVTIEDRRVELPARVSPGLLFRAHA